MGGRSFSVASDAPPDPREIARLAAAAEGKEGWLLLRIKHKWERRYFVLKPGFNVLVHQKSPKESKGSKQIGLFLTQCMASGRGSSKHIFQLQSPTERHQLRAETAEEMEEWITALQAAGGHQLQEDLDAPSRSASVSSASPSTAPQASLSLSNSPSALSRSNSANPGSNCDLKSVSGAAKSSPSVTHSPSVSIAASDATPKSPALSKATSSPKSSPASARVQSSARASMHVGASKRLESSSNPRASVFVGASKRLESSAARASVFVGKRPEKKSDTVEARPFLPKFQLTVTELLKRNSVCADCSATLDLSQGNAFVARLLGMFFCKECALLHHEMLGSDVSDIHALAPCDSPPLPVFNADDDVMSMTFFSFTGNKKGNEYWEHTLGSSGMHKPLPTSSVEEKRPFVEAKYLRSAFRASKSGALSLKNEKKKWKRMWISVEARSINVYASKDDMKAEHSILLQSCGVKLGESEDKPEEFKVISPQRQLTFKAVTFPAAMVWANAIKVAAAVAMRQLSLEHERESEAQRQKAAKNNSEKDSSDSLSLSGAPQLTRNRSAASVFSEEAETLTCSTPWGRARERLQALERKQSQFQAATAALDADITAAHEALAALQRQRLEQNRKFFALEPSEEFVSALPLQVVTEQSTGRITGGTLYALVEALTVVEPCDEYWLHFLLSYRSFTTAPLVLRELAVHFRSNVAEVGPRVCRLLEEWVCAHFSDLRDDDDALDTFLAFCDDPVEKCGFDADATQLRILVHNQLARHVAPRRLRLDTAPAAEEAREGEPLQQQPPLETARQLALLHHESFCRVQASELLDRHWEHPLRLSLAPNVCAMKESGERLKRWALGLLATMHESRRGKAMEWLIDVAFHSLKLKNFHAAAHLLLAIEDPQLLLLDGAWSIAHRVVPNLLELRKALAAVDGHRAMKEELYAANGACVPFLEPYLADLEVDEGRMPRMLPSRDMINFSRCRRMAEVAYELQRYQRSRYVLHAVGAVQAAIIAIRPLSHSQLSLLLRLAPVAPPMEDAATNVPVPTAAAPSPPRTHSPPPLELMSDDEDEAPAVPSLDVTAPEEQ